MLKIVVNINKQDTSVNWSVGQALPTIEGKLVSVEASGKELLKLQEGMEIPLNAVDTASITWHGRNAGRVLRVLRELLSK